MSKNPAKLIGDFFSNPDSFPIGSTKFSLGDLEGGVVSRRGGFNGDEKITSVYQKRGFLSKTPIFSLRDPEEIKIHDTSLFSKICLEGIKSGEINFAELAKLRKYMSFDENMNGVQIPGGKDKLREVVTGIIDRKVIPSKNFKLKGSDAERIEDVLKKLEVFAGVDPQYVEKNRERFLENAGKYAYDGGAMDFVLSYFLRAEEEIPVPQTFGQNEKELERMIEAETFLRKTQILNNGEFDKKGYKEYLSQFGKEIRRDKKREVKDYLKEISVRDNSWLRKAAAGFVSALTLTTIASKFIEEVPDIHGGIEDIWDQYHGDDAGDQNGTDPDPDPDPDLPNYPPTVNPAVPTNFNLTVGERQNVSWSGYFGDPNGDSLEIRCSEDFVDLDTNYISFSEAGNYSAVLTAEDPFGEETSVDIYFNINSTSDEEENKAPVLNESLPMEFSGYVGDRFEPVDLNDYVSDPEGKRVDFSWDSSKFDIHNGHLLFLGEDLPGEETVNIMARDPEGAIRLFQLKYSVEEKPEEENKKPEMNFPDEIDFLEDSYTNLDLRSFVEDEDISNVSFSVNESSGIDVEIGNGVANISGLPDWHGLANIIVTATDSENLFNETSVGVVVNPVYDPMKVNAFNVSQNATNGNFIDVLLDLNATDAKIKKAVLDIGEFSKQYNLSDYEKIVKDSLNLTGFSPGEHPVSLELTDELGKSLSLNASNVSVMNDIFGYSNIQGQYTNLPKISGIFSGVDDNLKKIEVNVTKEDELIAQYNKTLEDIKSFELSKMFDLSGELPGDYKLKVTAEDYAGAEWVQEHDLNVPNDPASIFNYNMSEDRSDLQFNFSVFDPDTPIFDVEARIDGGAKFDMSPKDGNFNEKNEDAESNREIGSLNSGYHNIYFTVDGVDVGSSNFYKSAEPELTEENHQFENRWVNGSAVFQGDLEENLDIKEVYLKLNEGDWEEANITPGNEVSVDYNVSFKDVPKGQDNDIFAKIIDNEGEREVLLAREYNPREPRIQGLGVDSNTLEEVLISGILNTDGLDISKLEYKLDDGEWKGLGNDSEFEILINSTTLFGEHNVSVRGFNEVGESVVENQSFEIDDVKKYSELLDLDNGNSKHRDYIEDYILGKLDGRSSETWDALNNLVGNFSADERDLCIKIVTGLSNNGSAEIQTVNKLYEAAPDLKNMDYNFTLVLSENDAFQKAESLVGNEALEDMIGAYENLNELEKDASLLQVWNRTATDSGDALNFCFTDFADELGLDTSNETDAKICWAYYSMFDGHFNNNHEVNDSWVRNYMIEQAKAIGVEQLRNTSKQKDSLIFLGNSIMPRVFGMTVSDYTDKETFIPVAQYKWARNFWEERNLDDVVLGKSIKDGMSDLQTWIGSQGDDSGEDRTAASYNWEGFNYTRGLLLEGENPDIDCNFLSEFATFLIRAQNHLNITKEGNVTNGGGEPLKPNAVYVHNHAGLISPWHNSTDFVFASDFLVANQLKYYKDMYASIFLFSGIREIFGTDYKGVHWVKGMKEVNVREDFDLEPHYNMSVVDKEKIGEFTPVSEVVNYLNQFYRFKNGNRYMGPIGASFDKKINKAYNLTAGD